jgi:FAD/FMN-containing dehydrogenase
MVNVFHCGPVEQAARDLAQLRAFGLPAIDSIEAKPYLAVQSMNDEAMRWGHRFYMKSAFLPDISDDLMDAVVGHLTQIPEEAQGEVSIWAAGRAISTVPEDATAYTGRDAAHWLAAEILWDDAALDDPCRGWVRAVLADVSPFALTGRYVNDVADAGDDVVRSVYGDAKYERLVGLKRVWDPDNVFRLNQNVRP